MASRNRRRPRGAHHLGNHSTGAILASASGVASTHGYARGGARIVGHSAPQSGWPPPLARHHSRRDDLSSAEPSLSSDLQGTAASRWSRWLRDRLARNQLTTDRPDSSRPARPSASRADTSSSSARPDDRAAPAPCGCRSFQQMRRKAVPQCVRTDTLGNPRCTRRLRDGLLNRRFVQVIP